MIEVEKKFQPTDEQLAKMLEGAEFVSDKEHTDIYYDMPDFRFFKRQIKLRKRNDYFELKIELPNGGGEDETEDEKLILEKMGFDGSADLQTVVDEKLIPFMQIKTKRKKYKKEGFTLDIDETDFGYNMVEIELLVEKGEDVVEAKEKIMNFANSYGFQYTKLLGKGKKYLIENKPEIYKQIWGDK